jgi:2-hydroxy-3-oxopropionate reductase
MKPPIGFIGLGIMGQPMAHNLLRAGFPLHVWARRAEATTAFTQAGATAHDLPQTVAEHSDIVILIVSDSCDVEELVLGDNGLIHGLSADNIVIDMSTISPDTTRDIAERLRQDGVHMFDAPVSGGQRGAVDGTLSVMVGGPGDVYPRILPVLQVLGKNIVHVGSHGAGQVAKACNQLLVAQTLTAIAEALLFAKANGVDAHKVRDALLGGFAYSRALEVHGKRMLDSDFQPGFKARLHQKDLNIVAQTAKTLGMALPGTALSTQYVNAAVGHGFGELDSSAILSIIEKLTNTHLTDN